MMKLFLNKKFLLIIGLVILAWFGYRLFRPAGTIDFSADVKPILNKKCISCHGGVKAKAGFSVLFREEALAATESGKPAIIPGDPEGSEMIRRISTNDPEERMPYKHEPLSKDEVRILKSWIRQGAKWGDHWAYLPVAQVKIPSAKNDWVRNDVDRFILEKLKEQDLKPSAEADKATLLRRVSLDLIGLYPTKQVAEQYLNSTDEKAYEMLVDSLLASPRYGERWASLWLDLSRYADTKGYESDGGRTIWKYRDWLIRSLNEDKPYDQFITEQIAGDLLPDPTDAQYIATGFSRNSMTNDEGGTDNEEFRVAAVMDRVNTTWESLMSTTFSCVQCHSHPYDPFRHEEYYQFMAYFNNTRDEDTPGEYPLLREFTDSLKNKLDAVTNWVKENGSIEEARRFNKFLRTGQPAIHSTTADSLDNAVIAGKNYGLAMRPGSYARLKNVDLENAGQMIWNFYSNKPGVIKLHIGSPDGPVLSTISIKPVNSWRKETIYFPAQKGVHDIFLQYTGINTSGKNDIAIIFDFFAFLPELPGKDKPGYAGVKKSFRDLVTANVPSTPVMVENPKNLWRKTFVFERGNQKTPGQEVQPAVPKTLRFAMPENAPPNRLGLAMWLTDKRNPLVSRTIMNRLWEQLFGAGIAETLEDMGTQGIPPTHQELLDHLSWKLMHEQGWSLKKALKELVMSATYRQDSRVTEEMKKKDPANKYYARGPRIRLSAEQLRDQHLSISGLLSEKMYGPGVMPWQPEGIWLSPYNGERWKNSTGEDQYRRAVYTYWKRTSPYPSMISFDGVQRVLCTARRIRTNTPLQALVTLNDSAYLDMSRHFAYRMQSEAGVSDPTQQIAKGYEIMTFKKIPAATQKVFVDLYHEALNEFKSDEHKTCEMIGVNNEHAKPETAALVVVANAMLNLDEIVTRN